jgi:hypothetical protein
MMPVNSTLRCPGRFIVKASLFFVNYRNKYFAMSNHYLKWGIITAMTVIGMYCQSKSQEKWTKDMELSTYNGGGMVPESKTVIIKDSTCTYVHWRMPKTDTLVFTLSKQELDDLLKEINTIHFRDIISGETGSIAYDKPTTSVTFKWNGKTHEVSVGATEGIKKGDASGFYKLYNYILSLAEKKIAH